MSDEKTKDTVINVSMTVNKQCNEHINELIQKTG